MIVFTLALAAPELEPVEPHPDEALPTGPDRSKAPEVLAPTPLDIPDLEEHRLGPGVVAYHVRVPRLRKATVDLVWWSGRTDLSPHHDPSHTLFGNLWGIASENHDGAELSELKDVLDMELWAYLGDHEASAGITMPLDDMDRGLDVLEDIIENPTFPGSEMKLQRQNLRRYFEVLAPASPQRVSSLAMGYAWNPADHPYGYRPDLAAVDAVKRKDLEEVHRSVIASGPLTILVAGDAPWETFEPKLKRFADLGTTGERSDLLDSPRLDQTRVIAVAMPDSKQVTIRMRQPAPARNDADHAGMEAAAYALGGHFLARFNKNLREDKGWTYGVGAYYTADEKRGSFNVSVDVPGDTFAKAVVELQREIEAVATEGVTDAEIDAWWRAEVTSFNETRGTIDDVSSFYANQIEHEETIADRLKAMDEADRMTVLKSQEIAKRHLGAEVPRLWVVVGPKDALQTGLETLGWDAEWLSPTDAVHGRFE